MIGIAIYQIHVIVMIVLRTYPNPIWHTLPCRETKDTMILYGKIYIFLPYPLIGVSNPMVEMKILFRPSGYNQRLKVLLLNLTLCIYIILRFPLEEMASSGHGSNTDLQWPFQEWGADVVIAGHNHSYERIVTGLPYFVNGLGGISIHQFAEPTICGSEKQFNTKYGAQKVTVTSDCMTFEFIDVDGGIQDTYTLDCGGCTQGITSPTPCTQICNTSETFCWNECTDTSYWLGVGTSQSSVASSPWGDIFAWRCDRRLPNSK